MSWRTVAQLLDLYLRHAEVYYRRPDGTPTREAINLRASLAHLRAEAGDASIADLSRAHIKACRACGASMTPHAFEGAAAFIRRKTCGVACAAVLRRGAPRRGPLAGPADSWKRHASRTPPRRRSLRHITAEQMAWIDPTPANHLGLAHRAAGTLAATLGCSPDELLGDAYLALVDAARTFRPEKGYRFSTHAVTALRFRLYGAAMRERGRVPRDRRGLSRWHDPLGLSLAGDIFDESPPPDRPHEDVAAREDAVRRGVAELRAIAEELGPQAARIVEARLKVHDHAQAARALGVSRSMVQKVMDRVRAAARGESPA